MQLVSSTHVSNLHHQAFISAEATDALCLDTHREYFVGIWSLSRLSRVSRASVRQAQSSLLIRCILRALEWSPTWGSQRQLHASTRSICMQCMSSAFRIYANMAPPSSCQAFMANGSWQQVCDSQMPTGVSAAGPVEALELEGKRDAVAELPGVHHPGPPSQHSPLMHDA